MRFSAIMQNQSTKAATALPTQLFPRYGLLGGINISGPTGIQDGLIGAATVHAASGQNYAQWTNFVPPNDATLTMACILRLTSTSGGFVCGSSTGGTTWAIMLSSGVLTLGIPFGTSASSGLPALQVGHAYFLAASTTTTSGSTTTSNKQNFVVKDLVTGVVQTSTASTSVTLSAPTGGVQWGDAGGNNASSLGGYLAAMMFAESFLTQPELRMWAEDPWSFWYPNSGKVNQLIIQSLSTPPSGSLPSGAQWYDLPIQPPRDRGYGFNRSSDQAMSIDAQNHVYPPFRNEDSTWQLPFGQWQKGNYREYNYDQSMSIQRQILIQPPPRNEDSTWQLPIRTRNPFNVSADQSALAQSAKPVGKLMTDGTTELPVRSRVPFNVSFDQAASMPLTAKPFGGLMTDGSTELPVQRFRPNVSYDQQALGFSVTVTTTPFNQYDWPLSTLRPRLEQNYSQSLAQIFSSIKPPVLADTGPLPFRVPYRSYSYDQSSQAPFASPFSQFDWPLPTPRFRIDQNYAQWFNPTQMFTGNKPLFVIDWPLPIPLFRPSSNWDWATPASYFTAAALPLNQYDWPLPIGARRERYGLIYHLANQAGQQPFSQTEWPLPIPQFRPDATWIWPSQVWLTPVAASLPFNQYDWPVPNPLAKRLYGSQYASQPFQINFPFNQYDWPLPTPFRRPDSNFVSFYNPDQFVVKVPFAQYDWPLPTPPAKRLYGTQFVSNIYPFLVPPGMNIYDLPIPPRRPDANFTYFYAPAQMLQGAKPFLQTDWPVPTPRFRPSSNWDWAAQTLLSQVFMALPPEWVLPAPIPYRDYSFMQGLNPGTMFVPPFPLNQYDWPVPTPRFRIDQTSFSFFNPTQVLGGQKPFSQIDWPLPQRSPYGNNTIYTITAPNNPNIYPPTPSTVKIEWLIRARRRGRR